MIIFFILMILMNDSEVLLWGEIISWSLLGFKGSEKKHVSSGFKIHMQNSCCNSHVCLIIKSFPSWWSFLFFLKPLCVIQGWYCNEKLDDSQRLKGSLKKIYDVISFAPSNHIEKIWFLPRDFHGCLQNRIKLASKEGNQHPHSCYL